MWRNPASSHDFCLWHFWIINYRRALFTKYRQEGNDCKIYILFILERQEESSDDETEEGEVEDDHPSDTEVSAITVLAEGFWETVCISEECPYWGKMK